MHHFPEHIERVQGQIVGKLFPVIGSDIRRCPHCGGVLSYAGPGNRYPFCRQCHERTRKAARRFSRRYEL